MKWNSYKTSRYNHLIPIESGNYLLFNTLRLSLLEIEKNKAEIIATWGDGMEFDSKKNYLDQEDLNILSDNCFIVKKDFDETLIIKNGQKQYKKFLFERGDFQLLVNTTNNCNMRCSYCFEGDKKTNKLSLATIESITYKIKHEVENPQAPIKSFIMTWFGGEPLLNQKAIEQLSSNLISVCEQHNIQYDGRIITNRY